MFERDLFLGREIQVDPKIGMDTSVNIGYSGSVSPNELKAIRQRLDLTQAALAAKLGVTREAVARWETGERAISGPVALAIRSLKPKKRAKRSK